MEVLAHPEGYVGKHTKELQTEEEMSGDCPNCGSTNYFSRSAQSKIVPGHGRVAPAPHCMDCGHNGMYDLQGAGLVSGAGGSPIQRSQQLPTVGFQGRVIIGTVS